MKTTRLFFLCCCGVAQIALALTTTGCKSSGAAGQTPPSGVPEVALEAKSANEVKAVATEFFRNRGYVERDSRHAYEMVFDKPTKRDRALRVRLRLYKQTENSWRLVGTPLGVEGWRSDLESEVVLPQGASQIQGLLVQIKSRVEATR